MVARTAIITLMLAVTPPAECPHSVLCQAAPDPFADYYERRPKTPEDLLVCADDETPGVDCNCVDGDEDACRIVPWTECDTDSDCEIKARSPYGFTPMTDILRR